MAFVRVSPGRFEVGTGVFGVMTKKLLALDPRMSPEAHIANAADWSKRRTMREYRGPGDMERALTWAANTHGFSKDLFWKLRYQRPSDMLLSTFLKLKLAQLIDEHSERQRQLLKNEIERAKADGINGHLVDAASAWVAAQDQEPEE